MWKREEKNGKTTIVFMYDVDTYNALSFSTYRLLERKREREREQMNIVTRGCGVLSRGSRDDR